MKKSLVAVGSAAILATAAHATVTGLSAEFVGTVGDRDIYSISILSDGPNAGGQHDVNLNIIAHYVVGGSMASILHTDNYVDDAGASNGHWNMTYTIGTPAPGALALLGMVGVFGRSRRRK